MFFVSRGFFIMSCLHHEQLLEDCYERAYESFAISNKLNEDQMQELLLHKWVADVIEEYARKLFEDMCQ